MNLPQTKDTICALATAAGMGALAVIRISGIDAFTIGNKIFKTKSGKKKDFNKEKTYTLHYGMIIDHDKIVDEVLVSVFRNPNSYTGEDTLEISCHGSVFIQQEILQVLQKNGARLAEPGEYTLRAFLNGKLDLAQAEAVADLISSQHAAAHKTAIQQLRSGYSSTIKELRTRLIDFASLLELELDFAEEDVEFAHRGQLKDLVTGLLKEVRQLRESFATGNALKNGVPVVIAGKPNVGKSTLLNALLNEEKAIVSAIAGTTRDVIEDHLIIQGIRFRFMDTAGLRITDDTIEKIGVAKTYEHLDKASIVLYICDPGQSNAFELAEEIKSIQNRAGNEDLVFITVINKMDQYESKTYFKIYNKFPNVIFISAINRTHLHELSDKLIAASNLQGVTGDAPLVTNARHAEALSRAEQSLNAILDGMQHLSTDLLALELKNGLYHLAEITGEVYTDDLLGNIFSKFCIGK